MQIRAEEVISRFSLRPFGAKGWMTSDDVACPFCGKKGKLGWRVDKEQGVMHCFKCGESSSIIKFLLDRGERDLIQEYRSISIDSVIKEPIFATLEDRKLKELPEKELPMGCKRIYYDRYLESRGFTEQQYEQFNVCVTNHPLERRLHNYLIFSIYMRGVLVGWVARSKHSKEWHKADLDDAKTRGRRPVLRYENSSDTDFACMLGGFDEITNDTRTLYLVEGLFDKTNLSNLLNTDKCKQVKVCFTFGDKVSDGQIDLLRGTNVENIVMMYDYRTIRAQKACGLRLSKYFNVEVCEIKDEDVDPGNMSEEYLRDLLKNKKNILYFYTFKIDDKNRLYDDTEGREE